MMAPRFTIGLAMMKTLRDTVQTSALAAAVTTLFLSIAAQSLTQAATPDMASAQLMQGAVGRAADRDAAVSEKTKSGKPKIDLSGQTRVGKGSFYANSFFYRTMANGRKMDPTSNNAASRTLPLGTTAKVTNLDTGKSAIVTIQDRGPYVDGRIVDLSPATARRIGLSVKQGIVKVAVAPIAVPLPNGEVKLGAAAENPKVALNINTYRDTVNNSGW